MHCTYPLSYFLIIPPFYILSSSILTLLYMANRIFLHGSITGTMFCASLMCTYPSTQPISLNNSTWIKTTFYLPMFWIMFTYLMRFCLLHESFPSIGWTFLGVMIKQNLCNKLFLSTVISAFPIIGIVASVWC